MFKRARVSDRLPSAGLTQVGGTGPAGTFWFDVISLLNLLPDICILNESVDNENTAEQLSLPE